MFATLPHIEDLSVVGPIEKYLFWTFVMLVNLFLNFTSFLLRSSILGRCISRFSYVLHTNFEHEEQYMFHPTLV